MNDYKLYKLTDSGWIEVDPLDNLYLENADPVPKKLPSNNTSGFSGVVFVKANGKYRATIRIDGKNKSLGMYDTIEKAIQVKTHALKLIYQMISKI